MKQYQLITGLLLVPLLLSGCGSKPAVTKAEAAKSAASAPAQAPGQSSEQPAGGQRAQAGANAERMPISENEMRLRMLSQSLLAVDKAEGLAFTKQQAEQLLPLTEAAVAKKELTAEQQESMLKVLTPEQTKFYESSAGRMKPRTGDTDGGTPPKAMTEEERKAMKEQRSAEGGGQNPTEGQDGGRMQSRGQEGNRMGAGAAIGQQLVDLLKERSK